MALIALALAVGMIEPTRAHETEPTREADGSLNEADALHKSQDAVGRILSDHTFRDRAGKTVRLHDFKGQPVVINLIYTACTHYCPLITQNLARGIEAAQTSLGENTFKILSIGFDVRNDYPDRMAAYRRAQGIDLPDWRFLSTDKATITALTQELGFAFHPAPHGFDHLAQTTIMDPEARVFRQIYGDDPGVRAFVEPLKSLRFGQVSSLGGLDEIVERVRLFCTLYDPATGTYQFDWSIFIGIVIGLLCIAAILTFLTVEELRRRRAGRRA